MSVSIFSTLIRDKAVNRVYMMESAGSMAGGLIFSFLLVKYASPLFFIFSAGLCLLL